MKFVPRHKQIIGRMVLQKVLQRIIRPDATKDSTKFILVDAVGPGAAAAGIKVGDLVIPKALGNIVLDGGTSYRPVLEEEHVACFVIEPVWDNLLIQNDSGSEYVPIGDPNAALPLGVQPPVEKPEAA